MISEDLKAARKRLGMTQAQLAAALKLRSGDRTIRNMESGRTSISGPVEVAVGFLIAEKERQGTNFAR